MLTPAIHDHVQNPRNVGPLLGATHKGQHGMPGDGPHMILWLRIEGDQILSAAYSTYGCPNAIACGSMTAQIVSGRTIAQAKSLTIQDLDLLLGGLPEGKGHCAELAISALTSALENLL